MTEYWALTIWQPWASLIIEGWKPMEFRKWKAPDWLVDKRLAVHAGSRPVRVPELRSLIYRLEQGGDEARSTGLIAHDLVLPFLHRVLAAPRSLPMSCVMGLATVGTPIRDAELSERMMVSSSFQAGLINDSDRAEHSNYGWPLSNIERFHPPVQIPGHQGLWPWKTSTHDI